MIDLPTLLALFAVAASGLTVLLAATTMARHERLAMWSSRLALPARHRDSVSCWQAIGASGHGECSFRTPHVAPSPSRLDRKAA